MSATFKIGKTYYAESGPAFFEFKVTARTAKFITIIQGNTRRRCAISSYDGHEYAMPFGKYSMAIQIDAAHVLSEVSA